MFAKFEHAQNDMNQENDSSSNSLPKALTLVSQSVETNNRKEQVKSQVVKKENPKTKA